MSTEVFPSSHSDADPHHYQVGQYTPEQISEYNKAVYASIAEGNPTWLYNDVISRDSATLYYRHHVIGTICIENDGTYTGMVTDFENPFTPQLFLHKKVEDEAKSFVANAGIGRYVAPDESVPEAVTIPFPVHS